MQSEIRTASGHYDKAAPKDTFRRPLRHRVPVDTCHVKGFKKAMLDFSSFLHTMDALIQKLEFLEIAYTIAAFLIGTCFSAVVRSIRRYKLKCFFRYGPSKNVELYLPIRKDIKLDESLSADVVIYEEMLLVPEIREMLSDYSKDYNLSIPCEYSNLDNSNMIFFGCYLVHPYIDALLRNIGRIHFSCREETYEKAKNNKKSYLTLLSAEHQTEDGSRYIYIDCNSADGEWQNNSKIRQLWHGEVVTKNGGKSLRLEYCADKEDVVLIIRLMGKDYFQQKEHGTVHICSSLRAAEANLALARLLNHNRESVYRKIRKRKGNYMFVMKYQYIEGHVGEIDLNSLIDVTDLVFEKPQTAGKHRIPLHNSL